VENMNDIFLDGKVFGYGRHGGIGRMHYEIAKGVSPQLAVTLFHGLYIDEYNWDKSTLVDNVGADWRWTFKGSASAREVLERFWLDRVWNGFSSNRNAIYHSSYYRMPTNINNQKLLVSDFDCVHERYPELFSNASSVIQMKAKALQKADLIATISESSKKDLIRFHQVSEEKIRVVHLGVSSFFSPGKAFEKSQSRPYLVYVGSRAAYKNFKLLHDVFRKGKVRGYDLVVVGGECALATETLPSGGEIRWCSADDYQLRAIYRGAAVFIYPSLYEGFGIPPLEALACGCPVVASDIPVLREVLGDVVEYFDPLSEDALIDAIKQAIKNKNMKAIPSIKHIEQYTWERVSASFLKIYKGLE